MRFLKYFVLSVLLFCSCSKFDFRAGGTGADGEMFTISVGVPTSVPGTKAAIDGDGSGVHADRCRLQIWNSGELKYDRVAPVRNYRATFDDVFLRDADEDHFLFWADNAEGDYYVTDTLTKVHLSRPYSGCDDARDAFCRSMTGAEVKSLAGTVIMLERPFGQVNFIASDMDSLYGRLPEDSRDLYYSIIPEFVTLRFRMPSSYNVLTKEASDTVSVTYGSHIYSKVLSSKAPAAYNTIFMDYIFAPDGETSLKDFNLTLYGEGIEDIQRVFTNVPVKRNWRTNIIGDIITGTTLFRVALSDDWSGEF